MSQRLYSSSELQMTKLKGSPLTSKFYISILNSWQTITINPTPSLRILQTRLDPLR